MGSNPRPTPLRGYMERRITSHHLTVMANKLSLRHGGI
jgi:hypothetical protein